MSRSGSKPKPPQHPHELVAEVRLHRLEGRVQELHPPDPVLLPAGEPRFAGIAVHPQHQRLVRRRRGAVLAEREGRGERHRGAVAGGRRDLGDPGGDEGPPVAEQDARVLERGLHGPGERLPLRLGERGDEVGNDVVPAGEDDPPGGHRLRGVVPDVGDPRGRGAVRFDADHGGGEPDAGRRVGFVEPPIVHRREDDVLEAVPGDRVREQRADEEAGDGGVPVREVEVGQALVRPRLVLAAVLGRRARRRARRGESRGSPCRRNPASPPPSSSAPAPRQCRYRRCSGGGGRRTTAPAGRTRRAASGSRRS